MDQHYYTSAITSQGLGYQTVGRSERVDDDLVCELEGYYGFFGAFPEHVPDNGILSFAALSRSRLAVWKTYEHGLDAFGTRRCLSVHCIVLTRDEFQQIGSDPFVLDDAKLFQRPGNAVNVELPSLMVEDAVPAPRANLLAERVECLRSLEPIQQEALVAALYASGPAFVGGDALTSERLRALFYCLPFSQRRRLTFYGLATDLPLRMAKLTVMPPRALPSVRSMKTSGVMVVFLDDRHLEGETPCPLSTQLCELLRAPRGVTDIEIKLNDLDQSKVDVFNARAVAAESEFGAREVICVESLSVDQIPVLFADLNDPDGLRRFSTMRKMVAKANTLDDHGKKLGRVLFDVNQARRLLPSGAALQDSWNKCLLATWPDIEHRPLALPVLASLTTDFQSVNDQLGVIYDGFDAVWTTLEDAMGSLEARLLYLNELFATRPFQHKQDLRRRVILRLLKEAVQNRNVGAVSKMWLFFRGPQPTPSEAEAIWETFRETGWTLGVPDLLSELFSFIGAPTTADEYIARLSFTASSDQLMPGWVHSPYIEASVRDAAVNQLQTTADLDWPAELRFRFVLSLHRGKLISRNVLTAYFAKSGSLFEQIRLLGAVNPEHYAVRELLDVIPLTSLEEVAELRDVVNKLELPILLARHLKQRIDASEAALKPKPPPPLRRRFGSRKSFKSTAPRL